MLTKFPEHKYCQKARFELIGALITLAREADGDGKLIKRARFEIDQYKKLYPDAEDQLKVLDEFDKEAAEVELVDCYHLYISYRQIEVSSAT